jgi:hypothetical protein
MRDLDISATAAVLVVRLRRDVEQLQTELAELRALQTAALDEWLEATWREME